MDTIRDIVHLRELNCVHVGGLQPYNLQSNSIVVPDAVKPCNKQLSQYLRPLI